MSTLLQASALTKTYRYGKPPTALHAVDNVSLCVQAGERIAITGPSGCGKSTLLGMIGLLLAPTKGSIEIQEHSSQALSQRAIASMRNAFFGYVSQDFALVENGSVYENIEIPLLYNHQAVSKKEKRKKILALLEQMEIAVKIDEPVRNLSGGQRQRVAIARAIVNAPSIILADEPTGALDIPTGQKIVDQLFAYIDESKAIIIVTHNQDIAKRCSRILEMRDGKFIQ